MKKGTQTAIGIAATIIALAILALCFIGCFLYYLNIAIPNGHRMSTKINRDFIHEESIWISDDGSFYIINLKQENGKHNSFAYIKAEDGSFVKCSVSVNTGAGVNIRTTGEEKNEDIASELRIGRKRQMEARSPVALCQIWRAEAEDTKSPHPHKI